MLTPHASYKQQQPGCGTIPVRTALRFAAFLSFLFSCFLQTSLHSSSSYILQIPSLTVAECLRHVGESREAAYLPKIGALARPA